jgi:hypothetical protein
VLRAAAHAGLASNRSVRLGATFVAAQQHPDGRFGYYGAELVTLPAEFDPELDLVLPVTLGCLWALIETVAPGTGPYTGS